LTDRQLDVAKLACSGLTNAQVGRLLFITKNTVAYHLRNIYQLLDIHTRVELLAYLNLRSRSADQV
jgi:DNA-binding CsgD family transcriptional regulator